MFSTISKIILKLMGWECKGNYPYHLPKKVLIVAPHTSNWDFIIGLLVRSSIKDKIKFIGKKSLFIPPLGWVMYMLGGIPVDRNSSNSFVQSIVDLYKENKTLTIAMSPEGTRNKVTKFRTGYYYIAHQSEIPIVPVIFNWTLKAVVFKEPFYTKGNPEAELKEIENIFKGIAGKRRKNSFDVN